MWRGAKATVCDIKPAQRNIPMFLRPRPVSNAEDEQRTIICILSSELCKSGGNCGRLETETDSEAEEPLRLDAIHGRNSPSAAVGGMGACGA